MHIGAGAGAGTGYYTAIMAEVVGPRGQVTAFELDPELAARARANLRSWPHVDVIAGDGAIDNPGPSDALLVNAGATHPRAVWLDAVRPGGRLLVPLTVATEPSGHGSGGMLKITRQETQAFASLDGRPRENDPADLFLK